MGGKRDGEGTEVVISEWKGAPPEAAQIRGGPGKSGKGKGKGKWDPWSMMAMMMGGGKGWGGDGWSPYDQVGKGQTKSQPTLVEPEMVPLINRIKAFQRVSEENKAAWYEFCGERRDPARHRLSKLQEFIDLNGVP